MSQALFASSRHHPGLDPKRPTSTLTPGGQSDQERQHLQHHLQPSQQQPQQQQQLPPVRRDGGGGGDGGASTKTHSSDGATTAAVIRSATGCDDVVSWNSLMAQYDSLAASPALPNCGQHSLFPSYVAAATSAVVAGSPGGAAAMRNNTQVLLPPLLMRAPTVGGIGNDSSEPPTAFFGPGALPGLLAGSSPPDTGDGRGGGAAVTALGPAPALTAAGSLVLAGPRFLHVTPTAVSRHHSNGMVPGAVVCLPNDEDTASLGGGSSGAEAAVTSAATTAAAAPSLLFGSVPQDLMPSSAAALALYNRGLGLGGNVTAAAAAASAATQPLDKGDPLAGGGGGNDAGHAVSSKHHVGGSWLLMSSAFGKSGGGFYEHGSRASPFGTILSKPDAYGSCVGCVTSGTQKHVQNQQQHQQQQDQQEQEQQEPSADFQPGASNISLAALRPFNTSTQIPVDNLLLDNNLSTTGLLEPTANGTAAAGTAVAASTAIAAGDGFTAAAAFPAAAVPGGIAIGSDADNVHDPEAPLLLPPPHGSARGEPMASPLPQCPSINDLAAVAGGWLMSPDGGGTSRRFSRAVVSVHSSRTAAAVGSCSTAGRDRGGSSRPGALDGIAVGLVPTGPSEAPATGLTPRGSGSSPHVATTMISSCSAPPPLTLSPSRQASINHHHHHHHQNHHQQQQQQHLKRSSVRPFSADDLCNTSVSAPPGASCDVGGSGGGQHFCGSESGMAPDSPTSRWQRAARAAGLAASIARSFRTLRNQHDENLVQEEQLQVIQEIGAGSFARVHKCVYQPPNGGKPFLVAVKRIKPEMLLMDRDPEDLQLFIQEAQLLRKLNHPHIVKYIGLGIVAEAAAGGCGGSGGGDKPPLLDAEKLLELSRRSWGPQQQHPKRWRSGGGREPSRWNQVDKHRSYVRRQPTSAVAAVAAAKPYDSEVDADDDEEGEGGRAPPPPPLLRGVFIVEEFLCGGTLKGAVYQQMLRPQVQLYSNATALRWMAQVAGALSYMHTCRPKVLHRDIKLDNVLLQPVATATTPTSTAAATMAAMSKAGAGAQQQQNQQPTTGGPPPPPQQQQQQQQKKGKGDPAPQIQYDSCIAKLGDLGLAALLSHHRRSSVIGASDLEMEDASVPRRWPPGRHLHSQGSAAVRQRVSAATQASPHRRRANDAARLSRLLESHKRDRLGTYMYMAPEVYQRQKYDEKCDCFSFAMLLYEVFHRFITACSLENTSQMEKYARQVSQGFRPTIHEDIPAPLRRVIRQCWAQDPGQRPAMAEVARELWAMEARGVVAVLDRKQQRRAAGLQVACCGGGGGGGCVVS